MRRITQLVLVTLVLVACGSDGTTRVTAVVAEHSYGGTLDLEVGDPLAGADLRVYGPNDEVVYSATLDERGFAEFDITPGTYAIQVQLDDGAHCLWGETVFGVEVPAGDLTIQAGYMCAGQ